LTGWPEKDKVFPATTTEKSQIFFQLPRENMAEPVTMVRKRDGRVVPFDKGKIADAIFKAAQAVGGQDRYLAEDLAEAVTVYLNKNFCGKIPSVEEIQDCVERVLIKSGHARTAKAYILYRQQRARIRQVKEGRLPPGFLEEQETLREVRLLRDIRWSVRRSDEQLAGWDNQRIVEALVRETGLSPAVAEVIVLEVEKELLTARVKQLSSSLIRELVNAKLVSYGLEEVRNRHARLGVPFYDVRQLMLEGLTDPDELSWRLGSHIKKEYALSDVYSGQVVDSHLSGEMHLHHLDAVDQFLTVVLPLPASQELFAASGEWARLVSGEIYWDGRWQKAGEKQEGEYPWQEYLTAGRPVRFAGRQEIRFGLYLAGTERTGEETVELLEGLAGVFSIWPQQRPCFLLAYDRKILTADILKVLSQFPARDQRTIFTTELGPSGLVGRYLPRFFLQEKAQAAVFGQVSLNGPRIAMLAGKEEAFPTLLEKRIFLALQALQEKAAFWKKRTVSSSLEPGAAFLISLVGIEEAARCLGAVSEEEMVSLSLKIIDTAEKICQEESRTLQRPVVFLPAGEAEARERFSRLNQFPCGPGLSGLLLEKASYWPAVKNRVLFVSLAETETERTERLLELAAEVEVQLRFF